ncbi:MAG TPA: HEAT repeat domain-containing protein [Pyrinomonadaceae bacterium]|nr:HEAT repeat domain-containing protein [Pyrinomonadaceae bacterium]
MTQIGVFTTDVNLVVQVWDATLAQLTGISEESAQGQSLPALLPDLEQRGLLKRFQRSLDEGVIELLAPAFHHYLIACAPVTPAKHFDNMQQHVTIAPLREDDTIAGLIVTVEDVTDRLEHERELAMRLAEGDETTRLHAAETISENESYDAASLLDALSDDSWRVRRAAIKGVSQRAAPEAISALMSSMVANHQNPSLLNSALQVLASTDVDTVSPLLDLLKHPDADLRMQSALALGEQRDNRAAEGLIEALNDEDPNVRYHAIEALGKLKAVEVTDKLVEVAETGHFFFGFAALDALMQIGDPSVVPRIMPLLTDPLLADHAITLLGQLGDERVIAPLTELLNTPTSTSTLLIAEALASIHDRYQEQYGEGSHIADLTSREISPVGVQKLLDELENGRPENVRPIALMLGWVQGPNVARALTRLMGRADLQDEIIEALVRHGSSTIDLLIAQSTAEDLEVRRSAVVALGRIGNPDATPALVNALNDKSLALDAANALGQMGDARAIDGLLKLIGSEDASVRQATVSALNSLVAPQMAKRIVPLLHDPDPNVRESAIKIAGYFGYPEAAGALVELSRDPEEKVRCAAIEHLPFVEDKRVLDVLARAMKEETPNVRAAAARALGNMDGREVVQQLVKGLDDEDAWVRYFSARALGRRGSEESVGALERVIEKEKFNHVRIAALDSLGQIGGDRVAAIVGGLVEDDDADVARAAQVALEKSRPGEQA